MASVSKRLPSNAEGNYYVDSTCINCDTCREVAPNNFSENDGYSIIHFQPANEDEISKVKLAIFACPSGSIGSVEEFDRDHVRNQYPLKIENNVYYNGFNSPKSFGAKSYFIEDSKGNWLVDSPKFTKVLIEKFEEMGGIDYIFLTHQDDVANADKFAKRFNAKRIIHYYDRSAQRDSEILFKGFEPNEIEPNFVIIPTPGHTRGHMVLLYKNRYLFTGDHLYWRSDIKSLRASRSYCWYNWKDQVKSMEKLKNYEFSWILPGHGHRVYYTKEKMKKVFAEFYDKMSHPSYW